MSITTQTPRTRKKPALDSSTCLRKVHVDVPALIGIIKHRLELDFDPQEWQGALIHKIVEGYGSIFCAGTGYGKNLIFEVAVFERTKTFIMIEALSK
ncbi:hypothetical protein Clacol_007836 [Clathrus columnatus]|uniref:Uncharacterized protein n=1 Tax=Clathrus columnatus TaxID=1419009 RepID=A0AAV5AL24_9AGAM|nr:hypothetical protein Clacol_007836 [Clathrus columnatus]